MELALALTACIFALLAFVTAVGTLTYVLARRFSTHETRYEAPGETVYQFEQPPKVTTGEDGQPEIIPRPPVTLTEAEYAKRQRMSEMESGFESAAADLDF